MTWLCRFGLHKWGMMHLCRLPYSRDLVYGYRCQRCGKLQ